MSSIGSYASATSAPRTPATASASTCAVIVAMFVLATVFAVQRKDVTRGFDEVAHTSYVAHLQRTGEIWPALETMRMLDPHTFQFTGESNYLNHPPAFYML